MLVPSEEHVLRVKPNLTNEPVIAVDCRGWRRYFSYGPQSLTYDSAFTSASIGVQRLHIDLICIRRPVHDESESSSRVTSHEIANDAVRLQLIIHLDLQ